MRSSRLIVALFIAAVAGLLGVPALGAQNGASECPEPPAGMNVIVSNAAMILGTGGPDFICAGAGNNTIISGNGADIIHAGGGDDVVKAQGGNDQIFGDAGNDILHAGRGFDLVEGGTGNDRITGGHNRDTLNGQDGNDRIVGGSGNDTMAGGDGNDAMHGGYGKDTINGGTGRDRLSGNAGHDTIQGGADPDLINGGSGVDSCFSGEFLTRCEESPDADGDGFMQHEDCNDDDAAVHEVTEEILGDGIDQDCDGEDANSRPQITNAEFSIEENLPADTVVGTVVITDPDEGAELTVEITAGNTGEVFAIDSEGQLTAATLDHEAIPVYTLAVRATDQFGLANVGVIEVSVTDVNEGVTAEDAEFAIDENLAGVLGTIVATDVDGETALTFSITAGDPGGLFSIDAEGELSTLPLNHEGAAVHNLTVNVSDGELSADAAVTVTVGDVNEAPVGIDGVGSIDENVSIDTIVGTLGISDPDDGDSIVAEIVVGPNSFLVEGSDLTAIAAFDHETTPTVVLELEVEDAAGLVDQFTFTLTVNDVNEAPEIDAVQGPFSVAEDAAPDTSIGFVTGSDPDDGEITSWSITNGPRFFSIVPGTGELKLTDSTLITGGEVHMVEITFSDDESLNDVMTVSVNVLSAL